MPIALNNRQELQDMLSRASVPLDRHKTKYLISACQKLGYH